MGLKQILSNITLGKKGRFAKKYKDELDNILKEYNLWIYKEGYYSDNRSNYFFEERNNPKDVFTEVCLKKRISIEKIIEDVKKKKEIIYLGDTEISSLLKIYDFKVNKEFYLIKKGLPEEEIRKKLGINSKEKDKTIFGYLKDLMPKLSEKSMETKR